MAYREYYTFSMFHKNLEKLMVALFPRKLAEGSAFCNREEIRGKLAREIKNVEHAVLVSPRRYGKTSLVLKVIDDLKIPFGHVDLFLAINEERVVERFLDGIAQLINSIVPSNTKALSMVKDFFKNFNVSVGIGSVSVGLKFDPPKKPPQRILLEALEGLEGFLAKKNENAVFFIDEMQDIIKLPICSDVEFVLRSCAQKSKRISFIFSGSNRKLLKKLFEDSSRPLWKVCKKINLKRIERAHYIRFLSQASKKQWKSDISMSALDEILDLTECHPYYVNYLCSELWDRETPPTREIVEDSWRLICKLEATSVAEILAEISDNQKALLLYIAQHKVMFSPSSREAMSALKLTSRGILQSLKGLVDKDLVEEIEVSGKKGYRVLDPLIRQILLDS